MKYSYVIEYAMFCIYPISGFTQKGQIGYKSISRIHLNPVDKNRFSSIQKKLCLAWYYIQLSAYIKIYNLKIKTSYF